MSTKNTEPKKRSHKKKPAAPTAPKLDFKILKVQAKHTFTIEERDELGLGAARAQDQIGGLEARLSSFKKDIQSQIETAEMVRNEAFRKHQEGFEWREVEAVIDYNDPKKGEKTLRFHQPGEKSIRGAIIRVEPMSQTDLQMEMKLIEQAKASADTVIKVVDAIKNDPKPGEPLNSVSEAFSAAEHPEAEKPHVIIGAPDPAQSD